MSSTGIFDYSNCLLSVKLHLLGVLDFTEEERTVLFEDFQEMLSSGWWQNHSTKRKQHEYNMFSEFVEDPEGGIGTTIEELKDACWDHREVLWEIERLVSTDKASPSLPDETSSEDPVEEVKDHSRQNGKQSVDSIERSPSVETEEKESPLAETHQEESMEKDISQEPESQAVFDHREDFKEFVLSEAKPWYREHLGRLYQLWEEWNRDFFDSAFSASPYITFGTPSFSRAYGNYGRISDFGGVAQIRIRRSLLAGTHPDTKAMTEEGRKRFVEDVLLHEMIHQYQHEILNEHERSYKGHGPTFRDKANEISEKLGLGKARVAKKRGKDSQLPSCAHWPHNVRPEGYYGRAYEEPPGRTSVVDSLEQKILSLPSGTRRELMDVSTGSDRKGES